MSKLLIFVSTGRCGTKRITEILSEKLGDKIIIKHQMPISRIANIIGNVMFIFGGNEKIKTCLFRKVIKGNSPMVIVDPLISMILPHNYILSEDVFIVNIHREDAAFATSMFKLSRSKVKSFIAHNFFPFWQPYLIPFENLFSSKIKKKYEKINEIKNDFFRKTYNSNNNFITVDMAEVFGSDFLSDLIFKCFDIKIVISKEDLQKKTDSTTIE